MQKESDYRKAHNIKKGGGMNMGIGDGDEYMLINATRVSGGVPSVTTVGDCTGGSGEAIELTGPKEEQFKNFVGKRVEVSGTQKRARIDASGRPTGGSAPGGGELKLFEVEVASVREAAIATAQVERTETTARARTGYNGARTSSNRHRRPRTRTGGDSRPAETAPAATTALPHTASPLPLFELASLLAFAGAYGVRKLRKILDTCKRASEEAAAAASSDFSIDRSTSTRRVTADGGAGFHIYPTRLLRPARGSADCAMIRRPQRMKPLLLAAIAALLQPAAPESIAPRFRSQAVPR